MRLALLADVHANLEALEAVLADVDRWGAEEVVCAGDLVGYGPDPEPCIALLRERHARCVAGNHEGMVLGTLGFERAGHVAIRAALWTRARLTDAARAFLATLPPTLRLGEVVVCHGSLDDPERYLSTPERADAVLAELALRVPEAQVLVAGHTHHQFLHRAGLPWCPPPRGAPLQLAGAERWLVNPGSVGQSRDRAPLARYARLDTAARSVEFRELAYPHARTIAKLARAGLAARVCLPPPSPGLAARVDGLRTRLARLRVRHRERPPA